MWLYNVHLIWFLLFVNTIQYHVDIYFKFSVLWKCKTKQKQLKRSWTQRVNKYVYFNWFFIDTSLDLLGLSIFLFFSIRFYFSYCFQRVNVNVVRFPNGIYLYTNLIFYSCCCFCFVMVFSFFARWNRFQIFVRYIMYNVSAVNEYSKFITIFNWRKITRNMTSFA